MKGLKILLEQENNYQSAAEAKKDGWSARRPSDYSSDLYDMIKVGGFTMYRPKEVEQPDDEVVKDDKKEVKVEEGINVKERSALLLKGIKFFDGQSSKPMSFDEEAALNYVTSFLSELQKEKKLNDTNIDDLFVEYMVKFLTRNNKYPFKFEYDPKFYEISFSEVMENKEPVGLEKILVEVRKHLFEQPVGDNTGYIQYVPGSSGFAIVNPERGSADWDRVTSDYVRKTQKPIEDSQFTQTSSREENSQQQTPQPPQKRPEEELNITPKAQMIQKKAETEGVESIYENLPKDLQERLNEYINKQGYQTNKPNDQVIDNYDMIDLVQKESSFKEKGFDTFPIWRLKPNITEDDASFKRFAEMLERYTPDKNMCKTIAEIYAKQAEIDVPNATSDIQKYANYLTRCRRKNFKYLDFGKTKKLIDSFQSELGSRPNYQINYSTGKAGS